MQIFPSEVVSIFFYTVLFLLLLTGLHYCKIACFFVCFFCLNVILVINCASYSHWSWKKKLDSNIVIIISYKQCKATFSCFTATFVKRLYLWISNHSAHAFLHFWTCTIYLCHLTWKTDLNLSDTTCLKNSDYLLLILIIWLCVVQSDYCTLSRNSVILYSLHKYCRALSLSLS